MAKQVLEAGPPIGRKLVRSSSGVPGRTRAQPCRAAAPRRQRVAACHRCLQQAWQPLVPRLQPGQCSASSSGDRGTRSAAALGRDSAAQQSASAPDAAPAAVAGRRGHGAAPPPGAEQPEQQQPEQEQQERVGEQEEQQDSAGVRAALAALKFYKAAISPLLPPACRFQPTCSVYAMDAFQKYGVGKGFVLTAWRLLRCAPWGNSGFDPVRWPPPGLELLFRE